MFGKQFAEAGVDEFYVQQIGGGHDERTEGTGPASTDPSSPPGEIALCVVHGDGPGWSRSRGRRSPQAERFQRVTVSSLERRETR